MAVAIINEYNDSVNYPDEFRNKPFKEIIEHWIDNNSKNHGVYEEKQKFLNKGVGLNAIPGEGGRTTPSPSRSVRR